MINVFINRKVVNTAWGGGNKIVQGFFKFGKQCGMNVSNVLDENTDIALIINPHYDNQTQMPGINEILNYKYRHNKNLKIINRINEKNLGRIPQENRFDHVYIEMSKYCDGNIFVSNWLKKYYFDKDWHSKNNIVIHNGVDKEIFKNYKIKLSDKNNKINIITHHWSNNIGKGFKYYEAIEKMCEENPEKFTFTYMGRHRNNFKTAKVIGPFHGKKIGEELSKYDLYISASQYESGPNHVLEALACGLPVIIIDKSGGGIEMVKTQDNFFKDEKDLIDKILNTKYSTEIAYKTKGMKEFVREYCNYFKKVING